MTIELTDAQLVERCRAGDQGAWNELVERFSRYVYAIAVRGFRLPENDAEDVFQDVFARTFERLESLRDDTAIRPWLAQLTRNACVDRIRAGTREQPTEEPLADEVDGEIERLDEALDVHEGLQALSPELPRGARPLLRTRRELPRHRRSARSARRDDREPHLEVPRKTARKTRGKKTCPGPVWRLMSAAPHDEERLGELLGLLPPAPTGWVRAAQELPEARRQLDEIVERAEEDAEFRVRLIADLEAALTAAGYEPRPALSEALRARLAELDSA